MYSFADSKQENDAILSFTKRWLLLMKLSAGSLEVYSLDLIKDDPKILLPFRKMCRTIIERTKAEKKKNPEKLTDVQSIICDEFEISGLFSSFYVQVLRKSRLGFTKNHGSGPVEELQQLLALASYEEPLLKELED